MVDKNIPWNPLVRRRELFHGIIHVAHQMLILIQLRGSEISYAINQFIHP